MSLAANSRTTTLGFWGAPAVPATLQALLPGERWVLGAPGEPWPEAAAWICALPPDTPPPAPWIAWLPAEDLPDAVARGAVVAVDRSAPPEVVAAAVRRVRAAAPPAFSALALDVLDRVAESVEIADVQRRLVWVNAAFERTSGYRGAEVFGRTAAELFGTAEESPALLDAVRGAVERVRRWRGIVHSRHADGHRFDNYLTVERHADRAGGTWYVGLRHGLPEAILPEADDPSGTVARLRHAHLLHRALFDITDDLLLVADLGSGLFMDANPAALAAFGYTLEQMRQRTGPQLTHPDESERVREMNEVLRRRGRLDIPQIRLSRADGRVFLATLRLSTFEVDGRWAYLATVRDISESEARKAELHRSNRQLREVQERLVRAARFAQLGEIAAGVAHEVNNPAQTLSLTLQSLQEVHLPWLRAHADAATCAIVDESLRESLASIERIRAVTARLLPFARGDEEVVEVDLNEVIDTACRMVDNEIRHRARLEVRAAWVPRIAARPGRLVQLVTNLLINAAHAIPPGEAQRNHIRVTTWTQDGQVALAVDDSGTGIAGEIRDRIFDPFFTTQAPQRSSGLGLPLCQEIALAHGGTVRLASELGEPTRFELWLPVASPLSAQLRAPRRADRLRRVREGRPRVLIVDDEGMLLAAYRRGLGRQVDVVTFADPREALRSLGGDADYDALLLDVMMPDMDGRQLYEEIARRTPDLAARVLFCSGGAFTDAAQDFLARFPGRVLHKPIDLGELRAALATM